MPAAADGSGGIACIQNQIGVIVLRKRIWCSFLSLLVIINLLPLFDLSGIAAGTMENVIIELSGKTGSDYASGFSGGAADPEALQRASELIKDRQQIIKESIRKKVPAADFSHSVSCTIVSNSITARIPSDKISAVASVEGVSSCRIDRISEGSVKNSSDKDPGEVKTDLKGKTTLCEGYTGSGTLIAVIDSEFELSHDAFSVMPEAPGYDEEFVEKLFGTGAFSVSDKYTAGDIYRSKKVIFAYDYAEDDADVSGNKKNYHGTHVAAVAAGNSGGKNKTDFRGCAPDAQLALMKISDKEGTIRESALIRALDDAVKLCPDVINCSFGEQVFLERAGIPDIYKKIEALGIICCGAGGNSSFSYSDKLSGSVPAEYITYNTVGVPSAYRDPFSVASVSGDEVIAESYMKLNDREQVFYQDNSEETGAEQFVSAFGENTDYIYMGSRALEKDYEGYDVKNKVVVVKNINTPPFEKCRVAISQGAAGIVFVVNEGDEGVSGISGYDIPCAFVGASNEKYFEDNPTGWLRIVKEKSSGLTPMKKNQVSYFSSMGPGSDLSMKPEISAPGDDILSAAPGNKYSRLSGTSMATPCVSGKMAVLKQYLKEKGIPDGVDNIPEYLISGVMSNARPLIFSQEGDTTVYYSPRAQGAGYLDIASVIGSGGYLTSEGRRPEAKLGESEEGIYSFRFEIHNTSGETRTYTPCGIIQTDNWEKGEKGYINTMTPKNITGECDITFSSGEKELSSIIIPSGSSEKIDVSVRLHRDFVQSHRKIFKNGFFVDGFVLVNDDPGHQFSLPFTGFCGDWSSGGIFDNTIYDSENSLLGFDNTFVLASVRKNGETRKDKIKKSDAGVNLYNDYMATEISFGRNSLSGALNGEFDKSGYSANFLFPNFYMLREALDYKMEIRDSGGKLVFSRTIGDLTNYSEIDSEPFENILFYDSEDSSPFDEYEKLVSAMKDGAYTYTVSGYTVSSDGRPGRYEEKSFSFKFDNKAPVIEKYSLSKNKEGRLILEITANDENLLQSVDIVSLRKGRRDEYVSLSQMGFNGSIDKETVDLMNYSVTEGSNRITVIYDITGIKEGIKKYNKCNPEDIQISEDKLYITARDYAFNESEKIPLDVNGYGRVTLKFVDKNGAPVSGAVVSAPGGSYQAFENGIITADNLPLGKVTLRISTFPNNYYSDEREFSFVLDSKNYEQTRIIVLSDDFDRILPVREEEPVPEEYKPEDKIMPDTEPAAEPVDTGDTGRCLYIPLITISLFIIVVMKKRRRHISQ